MNTYCWICATLVTGSYIFISTEFATGIFFVMSFFAAVASGRHDYAAHEEAVRNRRDAVDSDEFSDGTSPIRKPR